VVAEGTVKSGLLEGLLGRPAARVLAALLMRPDETFYQGEVVRATGLRLQQVQRALGKLSALGVVTARPRGNRVYYRADSANPIHAELRALVLKTAGLLEALREALAGIRGMEIAFVYGSFATGEDTAESDVDLMVVGDVPFATVSRRLAPVQDKLGREVNPTVYPVQEFRRKLAEGHHFLTAVVEGPKLFVIGDANALERLASRHQPAVGRNRSPSSGRPSRSVKRMKSPHIPARL
jgi:predicted nucleotidyltransferase